MPLNFFLIYHLVEYPLLVHVLSNDVIIISSNRHLNDNETDSHRQVRYGSDPSGVVSLMEINAVAATSLDSDHEYIVTVLLVASEEGWF